MFKKKKKNRLRILVELIIALSKDEKLLITSSMGFLRRNLDFFVIRFYHYFLKTDAGLLFRNTNMEKQYQMFIASIKVLVNDIENPIRLQDHLDRIVASHRTYGVMSEHVNYFIDAFMMSLSEVFNEENQGKLLDVWYKVVDEFLAYFEYHLFQI